MIMNNETLLEGAWIGICTTVSLSGHLCILKALKVISISWFVVFYPIFGTLFFCIFGVVVILAMMEY